VRVDVENVSNKVCGGRLSGRLAQLEPKKRLKRPDGGLGSGGKGAENRAPGPPFSATFSHVQRLMR
jgi:hypothetical protein